MEGLRSGGLGLHIFYTDAEKGSKLLGSPEAHFTTWTEIKNRAQFDLNLSSMHIIQFEPIIQCLI